jgi:hypothetical protein
MSDGDRISRLLRTKLRGAGRQYAEARQAFDDGRIEGLDLPTQEGKARIVCRRHAEQRAVELGSDLRPSCFDADHPDCQGCVEDIRNDCIQTW